MLWLRYPGTSAALERVQLGTEERRALRRGLERFANESAFGLRRPEAQTGMGAATDTVRCHAADWPGEFDAAVANLGRRAFLSCSGATGPGMRSSR